MKKLLLSILFSGVACTFTQAQSVNINAVMRSVADNNKHLKALVQSNSAAIMEKQAENTPGATSVEYSPFFRSGAGGIANSELIVSQEFKLPSVYAARSKSISLRQDVLGKEYSFALCALMLEVQNLCYDLQTAMQTTSLINGRVSAADSLLCVCRKRIRQGDATAMELNRIRIDSMTLQTELAKNRGDIARLRIALQELGASEESLDTDSTATERDEAPAIPRSVELAWANAALLQARQETSVAKCERMPTVTLGYRRNTELHEASNGPLVGVSIPLFSNSRRIKASRLRQSAAQLEVESVEHRLNARRQALQVEAEALLRQLAAYDTVFMRQSLQTLMRAVCSGELGVAEYYIESARIYSVLQDRLAGENRYNKVLAELQTL